MIVKEIMTQDVASVESDTTVADAASLMTEYDIGSVPVCRNDNVVGILTDRDIVLRNIAQGKDPLKTRVEDVMTRDIFTVSPETQIEDASEIMLCQQVRRLPIVDKDKLVGIVSLGDIALEEELEFEASKALSEISEKRK